jgi:GAF domain-containing protein
LDVRFRTVELKTCYRDAKVAQRAWGQEIARRYVERVDSLHAAKDLFALRALDLSLNTGLYCETVMKTRQPLLVPDALVEEEWKSNPDIKLGMISYLGFPIAWPDGHIFGTICVLDNKRNEYSEPYRKLLLQFREVLQADLRWLTELGGELATEKVHLKRAEAKLCQDEEELRRMTDAIPGIRGALSSARLR